MTNAIAAAAMLLSALSLGAGPAQSSPGNASISGSSKPICKLVLAPEPGANPYQLCQTRAQWDALEASYAKDANRMVCHYEEIPGTKIGAHKVCGPQSAWEARAFQSREAVERIQRSTCVPGAGC